MKRHSLLESSALLTQMKRGTTLSYAGGEYVVTSVTAKRATLTPLPRPSSGPGWVGPKLAGVAGRKLILSWDGTGWGKKKFKGPNKERIYARKDGTLS